MFTRRQTRTVFVGGLPIGGGHPIVVQSMASTDTRDVDKTVAQILRLEEAGCELVRVAVPDLKAALALEAIRSRIHIPLVADIHFDYRLALAALDSGVDKLRINPGNIGGRQRVEQVVEKARARRVPIRIGVNAGSLDRNLLAKYGGVTPEALVESALQHIAILEEMDYHEIVVSLKASDVPTALAAYRQMAQAAPYPLHVGITEAGTVHSGTIRSAVGIGAILAQGIGDTVRVSLTGDPVEEVRVAWEILKSLDLRQRGPVLISCPTCGRCGLDLEKVAREVEQRLQGFPLPVRVAVMGCAVNGPGEARDADVGIAGGRGEGLVFRQGRIVRKVREDQLVDALMEELAAWQREHPEPVAGAGPSGGRE